MDNERRTNEVFGSYINKKIVDEQTTFTLKDIELIRETVEYTIENYTPKTIRKSGPKMLESRRKEIAQFIENNPEITLRAIAKKYDVAYTTVKRIVVKYNLYRTKKTQDLVKKTKKELEQPEERRGGRRTKLTDEVREEVVRLRQQEDPKLTLAEIAEKISLGSSTVSRILKEEGVSYSPKKPIEEVSDVERLVPDRDVEEDQEESEEESEEEPEEDEEIEEEKDEETPYPHLYTLQDMSGVSMGVFRNLMDHGLRNKELFLNDVERLIPDRDMAIECFAYIRDFGKELAAELGMKYKPDTQAQGKGRIQWKPY